MDLSYVQRAPCTHHKWLSINQLTGNWELRLHLIDVEECETRSMYPLSTLSGNWNFLTRLSPSSGSVPLLCFSFTKTTISLFLGGFWRVRNCLAHRLKTAFTIVLIGELVSYRADRQRDAIVSCLQFCVVEFGLCCTLRGIGEYGWTKDGILSHQNGFFLPI